MAYVGLYRERVPEIVAAGIKRGHTEDVRKCLIEVSLDDKVTALKHEVGVFEEKQKPIFSKEQPSFPVAPDDKDLKRFQGIYTDVSKLISPPEKSLFTKMADEFKDTLYESYWNKPLGRGRDPVPNLPQGFDPVKVTLGISTKSKITARELVSPDKLPGQVLFEDDFAHDLYVRTHQDYYTGEHVNRRYLPPGYNPCDTFGLGKPWDKTGIYVKRCLNWLNSEDFIPSSKRQTNFNEKTRAKVGKILKPCGYEVLGALVPPGHSFGLPAKRELYGVPELLQSCEPCLEKRVEADYMEYINVFRNSLKKIKPAVSFFTIENILYCKDENHTGWLPLSTVYSVCAQFKVKPSHADLEPLLKRAGILSPSGCVDYKRFVAMLHLKMRDFPDLAKLQDVPPEYQCYETSAVAATRDWRKIDNSVMPKAGIPSARFDLPYPIAEIDAFKESLGEETDVMTLVSPSIFTTFGVSHRDFFMPHDINTICEIFTNIGVEIPREKFEQLYEEAYQIDKTGGVCIETFRNLLDKLAKEQFLPVNGDQKEEK